MSETAVILMAYGSPERVADVPAYYADIRGGRPISPEHLDDLVARYRALGIEDSNPLNAITEATRAALEARARAARLHRHEALGRRGSPTRPRPRVAAGASRLVGLVLAPHYSRLSIAGYRRLLDEAVAGRAGVVFVESWHDDPGLIAFLADRIRDTDAHVVFTAHSLPARILEEGDPYQDQLLETARLVADSAGVEDWSFSFQSESPTGEPWLGPDILDHLEDLSGRGVESVLVCPVGFVSDHLEIRWDIDTEAQDKARELGLHLERIEMPNDDPRLRPRPRRDRPRRARVRSRHERRGPHRRRPRLADVPGLPEGAADAQGRLRLARPRWACARCRRCATSRSRSSRATPSGSSAATARARRRCCA